jgi:hypothetical protein
MSELLWLDGYHGERTDELLALEGKFRTDSIVPVVLPAKGLA